MANIILFHPVHANDNKVNFESCMNYSKPSFMLMVTKEEVTSEYFLLKNKQQQQQMNNIHSVAVLLCMFLIHNAIFCHFQVNLYIYFINKS